jgi:hypothetical protein
MQTTKSPSRNRKAEKERVQLAQESLLPMFPQLSLREAVELLERHNDNVERAMVALLDHEIDTEGGGGISPLPVGTAPLRKSHSHREMRQESVPFSAPRPALCST